MILSDRLFSLRKQRKLSLKEVAARCECSFQHLQKLEKGLALRPKLELLYRLAVYYNFSSDRLIAEAGKIPEDVYRKIVYYPHLIKIIRDTEV